MGENLINKVSKAMYFKDDFLGKPVKFKNREVYGIVTFLMKEIAKITYIDRNGDTKEKSVNCEYVIKNLEFPTGYLNSYVSIEYNCDIEIGTPVSILNIAEQSQCKKYAIVGEFKTDSMWFVSVSKKNGEERVEHFKISLDSILNQNYVIENLI